MSSLAGYENHMYNRRSTLTFLLAALLLGVIVHVDWHLGRPAHHRLSGDWTMHWLLGLATGVGYAFWSLRAAGARAISWFAAVVLIGFLLGQVVEPAAELWYDDMTLALVFPAVRWRIFTEFAAALLAGGVLVLLLRPAILLSRG